MGLCSSRSVQPSFLATPLLANTVLSPQQVQIDGSSVVNWCIPRELAGNAANCGRFPADERWFGVAGQIKELQREYERMKGKRAFDVRICVFYYATVPCAPRSAADVTTAGPFKLAMLTSRYCRAPFSTPLCLRTRISCLMT